jgi:hypothetical protein
MFQKCSVRKKVFVGNCQEVSLAPLTPEDNDKYSANAPTTLSAIQAASQSSSFITAQL